MLPRNIDEALIHASVFNYQSIGGILVKSKMDKLREYLSARKELNLFEERKNNFFGTYDVYIHSIEKNVSFTIWLELPEKSINNNIVVRVGKFPYYKQDDILRLINKLNTESFNGFYYMIKDKHSGNLLIMYRFVYTANIKTFDPRMYYDRLFLMVMYEFQEGKAFSEIINL